VLAFFAPSEVKEEFMRKLSLAALLLFVVSLAFAQIPGATPFSGDLTVKSTGGETMNGKMYFSGSKIRWEMNAKGHDSVMIMDLPQKISYMVMPQQKMYMEMRLGQHMGRGPKMPDFKTYDPNNPCAQNEDMTCEKVGTETVNGRSTDKWLFKSKKKADHTMNVWIDKKIHFPVRTVTSEGTQSDLTNVQEGPQTASLFEIPAGYRKFDMGAMMGGQMPQGKEDE
jgi:outer membrane lipoprotein-sorting protein